MGMKVFQERLKELRKLFGYTQKEVANRLGITQPSYIRYENGTSEPTLQCLANISEIYDVSVDYLLGLRDI